MPHTDSGSEGCQHRVDW